MTDFFDKIATVETLELKSTPVIITGVDEKSYKFTVNELTPSEIARCVDEFGEIDFLAVIYRSVRDPDGKRMSKEQANRLPPPVMQQFIEAYNNFVDTKKKSKPKKAKA